MSELSTHRPRAALAAAGQVGTGSLVLVGSGTAMASVCAVALFSIERSLGGVWAILAIFAAGIICLFLAYVFARLSRVMPSGAGLITFVSRAFTRSFGAAVVVPYLLLMMFLVGFESLIVGAVLERFIKVPVIVGAIVFVVLTWAVCRRGLRIGYRAQSVTTVALFLSLMGVSLVLLIGSARRGDLATHLFPAAPLTAVFFSAVGQALFLFLGFELITSHVEVAKPGAVARSLPISVCVLFAFYSIVSLGFTASGPSLGASTFATYVPQIAVAEQAGGIPAVIAVALICVLASFTSINGALLALSRLLYALAAQGVLPRHLASLDRKLVAVPALTALLVVALCSTLAVYWFGLGQASILAAAVTAALVYCVSILAREREPFRGAPNRVRRWVAWGIAAGLAALGLGVVLEANEDRGTLLLILIVGYGLALLAGWRLRRVGWRLAAGER